MLTTAFFESIADPFLLCDRAWLVSAANRAATQLLEKPVDQLINRSAIELLPPPSDGVLDSPVNGHVEWRSELLRQRKRLVLAISGQRLDDQSSGAEGWALRLQRIEDGQDDGEFIGRSTIVQELREFTSRIAASNAATILLLGESGTGKELIARRLHDLSKRASAPYVPVNCAALPESLLESELFGFEKGAFTGAGQRKEGLLETADGGMVFLDEIGELSLPLQAKLLRVLENHTFRRVGGTRDVSVDVCVIAATNADLEKAIESSAFRLDLYYRLNVVQIRLPALRERTEDIPQLTHHFLRQFSRLHNRDLRGIHPLAQRLLETYPWPGNVRELRNIIERAVLVETSPLITPESLALPGRTAPPVYDPVKHSARLARARYSLRSGERELIVAALADTRGNQSHAAALLGIGRFSLRYRMKKLGML